MGVPIDNGDPGGSSPIQGFLGRIPLATSVIESVLPYFRVPGRGSYMYWDSWGGSPHFFYLRGGGMEPYIYCIHWVSVGKPPPYFFFFFFCQRRAPGTLWPPHAFSFLLPGRNSQPQAALDPEGTAAPGGMDSPYWTLFGACSCRNLPPYGLTPTSGAWRRHWGIIES